MAHDTILIKLLRLQNIVLHLINSKLSKEYIFRFVLNNLLVWCTPLSIYLFIRHTPSNEYYVPGSPQHAIKVKDKNKADSKKGIKVHSVSVLYSRKESEDKNGSSLFVV